MSTPEVLIVGAGPTGLAAAIELSRLAIPFRLIDRATHPALYSQALGIQARTLEQFERYGIANDAVQQGHPLRRGSIVSGGKTLVEFPFEKLDSRYPYVLFLPQRDTERLLTEHLRMLGGTIERGVELVDFSQNEDRVNATLRDASGNPKQISARWLIGCDGAHSTTRKQLEVPFEGETVDTTFFLGDLKLEGHDVPGDKVRVYLHEGEVVFIGRLTGETYRLIVARNAADGMAQKEQLELSDFQNALNRCAGPHLKVNDPEWMTPFHVNQRKAKRYRIENVFLAGDACHVHSPVGGQGMNTGIQDVANLAWKLAAVRSGAPESLLESYHEERSAVGDMLLRNTSLGLAAATIHNSLLEALRNSLLPILTRFDWVRREILGFVSETAIAYRKSSIVMECGDSSGVLRAGDRMPNPDWPDAGGTPTRLLDRLRQGRAFGIAGPKADVHALRKVISGCEFLSVPKRGVDLSLLGGEDTVAVVRPDGYLGFRGRASNLQELTGYGRQTGLV